MDEGDEAVVPAGDRAKGSLPRKLGLMSAIAVLVGSTIGSGIFRSPAVIATRVPDEGLFLLTWVLGGFLTLCGALTYAELAAALPRTGGVFAYLREGFGKLPAFLFGWAELTVIRASALGAIATVFAEYFLRLLGQPVSVEGQSVAAVHFVAAGAILVVAVLNVLGVNVGAAILNLTASAKYGALVVLVGAAFVVGARDSGSAPDLAPRDPGQTSLTLFGLALISILWVYDGWADVTFVSGEVKSPQRNLPRALLIGIGSVIAIYLLTNLAYLHLLDIDAISASPLVAADSAQRMIGGVGVTVVSLAVMVSAFGTLTGSMMTGPRIFYAMADDGLFFKRIASVHPRFETPYVAIGLAAGLAMCLVMVRGFERLADTFVLGIWPFYAGGVAAVYALRRKRPDLPRPYRVLGYPVTPALFVLAASLVLGNAIWTDASNVFNWLSTGESSVGTGETLLVFVIISMGVPVFLIWERLRLSRFKTSRD